MLRAKGCHPSSSGGRRILGNHVRPVVLAAASVSPPLTLGAGLNELKQVKVRLAAGLARQVAAQGEGPRAQEAWHAGRPQTESTRMTSHTEVLVELAGQIAAAARRAKEEGLIWESVLMEAGAILDEDDETHVSNAFHVEPTTQLQRHSDPLWLRWYFRGTPHGSRLAILTDAEILERIRPGSELLSERWEDMVEEVMDAILEAAPPD